MIAGTSRGVILSNIRALIQSGVSVESAIRQAMSYAKKQRKTRSRSRNRRGKDKKKRKRRVKGVRTTRTGADYYRSYFK